MWEINCENFRNSTLKVKKRKRHSPESTCITEENVYLIDDDSTIHTTDRSRCRCSIHRFSYGDDRRVVRCVVLSARGGERLYIGRNALRSRPLFSVERSKAYADARSETGSVAGHLCRTGRTPENPLPLLLFSRHAGAADKSRKHAVVAARPARPFPSILRQPGAAEIPRHPSQQRERYTHVNRSIGDDDLRMDGGHRNVGLFFQQNIAEAKGSRGKKGVITGDRRNRRAASGRRFRRSSNSLCCRE